MTVRELRAALVGVSGNLLVVISADSEGNNYSPLSFVGDGQYTAEGTWQGSFKSPDPDDPEGDWDPEKDQVNAICLWPTS